MLYLVFSVSKRFINSWLLTYTVLALAQVLWVPGRIWSKINCERLFPFWRINLVVIFKEFLFHSFPYPLIWNSISKVYITKEVKNWLYDINDSAANKTKYSGREWCFFYGNEYQHSQKHKDFTINLIYWYLDSNSIVPKKWKKYDF